MRKRSRGKSIVQPLAATVCGDAWFQPAESAKVTTVAVEWWRREVELLPSPCWNQSCGVPAQPIVGQCRWKQPCASRHASIIRPVMTRSQMAQTRWSSSESHFRSESASRNAMNFSSRLRRMFLMDLIDSFRASQSNWIPDTKQVVPGLESRRSVRKLWGLPPSLAYQRTSRCNLAGRDQISLRQRAIHL